MQIYCTGVLPHWKQVDFHQNRSKQLESAARCLESAATRILQNEKISDQDFFSHILCSEFFGISNICFKHRTLVTCDETPFLSRSRRVVYVPSRLYSKAPRNSNILSILCRSRALCWRSEDQCVAATAAVWPASGKRGFHQKSNTLRVCFSTASCGRDI